MRLRKRQLLLGAIALIAAGCLFGGWTLLQSPPRYWESRLQFLVFASDLESLRARLAENAYIESVSVVSPNDIEVEFSEGSGDASLARQEQLMYGKLLRAIGVSPVWRSNDTVRYYLGATNKFGNNFQISFLSTDEIAALEPRCSSKVLDRPHGECIIALDARWALHYEWLRLP